MADALDENVADNEQMEPGILSVQILSPRGVVWQGKAQAISSENSQGPFDLLPEHAHFISMINNKPIVVVTNNGEEKFTFETAVIRLIDNKVNIFVDIT
jgi:F-type H+-transporting ATPase subunit epsilon